MKFTARHPIRIAPNKQTMAIFRNCSYCYILQQQSYPPFQKDQRKLNRCFLNMP